MKTRTVSLLVLYTSDQQILIQNRSLSSKLDEEWGFFGGGLKAKETKEEALIREAKEELDINLSPKDIVFAFTDKISWPENKPTITVT